jgi:protocatechuate 3,4-dioxygenase beta subunit
MWLNNFEFVVNPGDSIASEGSGKYLFVEGYVRSTSGKPIANAVVDTWEADADGEQTNTARFFINFDHYFPSSGFYDTQKAVRDVPDCRGRLRTDKDGKYSFRAVVPMAYPVPGDVSYFGLLSTAENFPNVITGTSRGAPHIHGKAQHAT